jgi:hypothetical protein
MVINRLWARLQAPTLDRRLAAGESTAGDRLTAVRADVLRDWTTRAVLANGWAAVLERADGPRALIDSRIPVVRAQVRAAEPDIRAMIDVLRDSLPVQARGVAMASRLLSDGTGPLYSGRSAEDLREGVRQALHHLLA